MTSRRPMLIGPIRMRALNTSVLTMNPMKMSRTPSSSPRKNDHVMPKRFRPLVMPGNESAERDEQRRRYRVSAAVPRASAVAASGSEASRLRSDRGRAVHLRDHRRKPAPAQQLALGHEHVRGEQRAEHEREGAGDVERPRQHADVARDGGTDRHAGLRVERVARRGDGRREHEHGHDDRRDREERHGDVADELTAPPRDDGDDDRGDRRERDDRHDRALWRGLVPRGSGAPGSGARTAHR